MVDDRRRRREECRLLADRLIVEYAGAVAPGQVLAAVFRVHRSLAGTLGLSTAAEMHICESFARRVLTEQVAGGSTTAVRAGVPTLCVG